MNRAFLFCCLFTGLALEGCGSDSGSPPADTSVPHDATVDVRADAAPAADVPAPFDVPIDLPAPVDTAVPDAPVVLDTTAPLDVTRADVVRADVAIDSGTAAEAQLAIDTARLDVSAVDLAVSESGGGGEAGGPTTYTAILSGAQEVPVVATAATGSATFTLSADRTQLTYLVTHNVTGGSASHIHLAAAGENGAVIYPFTPFASTMSGILTITATDADNLERGMLYVNVHSATYKDGEIRGQILHPSDSLWVANLTGSQENPKVTSTGTGTAAIILDAVKTNVRYHVKTTGLTLTNGHIHKAVATVVGGVIHPFSPIAATMDGTIALTGTDAQDLMDGLWYVNVHTATNPGGELRGQLMQPGEVLYSAALAGANEIPPVTTSATGGAQFILNPAGTTLRYLAVFTGLTATAAGIYTGAVGVNGAVLYPLTLTASGAQGTQALTPSDLTALNSGNLYINATTAANQGGEIRGQIGNP